MLWNKGLLSGDTPPTLDGKTFKRLPYSTEYLVLSSEQNMFCFPRIHLDYLLQPFNLNQAHVIGTGLLMFGLLLSLHLWPLGFPCGYLLQTQHIWLWSVNCFLLPRLSLAQTEGWHLVLFEEGESCEICLPVRRSRALTRTIKAVSPTRIYQVKRAIASDLNC